MQKNIINIAPAVEETPRAKRVAAYARVSCGKDTMLHSLAAQIDYYNTMPITFFCVGEGICPLVNYGTDRYITEMVLF